MKNKFKCLLLVRISTTKQLQDSDSPEHQIKRGLVCAERRFGIARDYVFILTEAYSGRKEERPSLDQAFEMVEQYGIQYLLVYDIDRLTRAGASHYEAIKRRFKHIGCDIVDVKGIIQPDSNTLEGTGGEFGSDFTYDWSVFAASEKAEVLEAQMAKDEARKILSRTIPIQISNAQQGRTNRVAPYGFKNTKIIDESGKPQPSKSINESEAYYVRKIFEGLASRQDVRSLCDELNSLGYKSRIRKKWSADGAKVIGTTGGVPLIPRDARAMVARPIYAGFILEKWTHNLPVPANHAGIVSLDLWNAANRGLWRIQEDQESPTGWTILNLKKNPEKRPYVRERPDFPFKSHLVCPICGKPVKASFSKSKNGNRFGYYHCNRGHKQVSLERGKLEAGLKSLLQELAFTPEVADRFEKHIRSVWVDKVGGLNKHLAERNKEIATLREEADGIFESIKIASHPMIIKRLEGEYDDLQQRIKLLEGQRSETEYSEEDMNRVIKWARYMVEHLDEILIDAPSETLRCLFWSLIFIEPVSLDNIRNRTPKTSPLVRAKDMLANEKCNLVDQTALGSNTLTSELSRWAKELLRQSNMLDCQWPFNSLQAT